MAKPWSPLACSSRHRYQSASGSDLTCAMTKEEWRIFAAASLGQKSVFKRQNTSLLLMDRLVDHCAITKRNRKRTVIIEIESKIDKHHQNSAQTFHCRERWRKRIPICPPKIEIEKMARNGN